MLLKSMRANLEHALQMPQDLEVRQSVQQAALLAGMAMGTTQTALAHSISYAFTGQLGMPHGIACSFTLPEVARFNLEKAPQRLLPIADAFSVVPWQLPEEVARWLTELGIGRYVVKYLRPDCITAVTSKLINPARASNNIRIADSNAALEIVQRSLHSFVGAAVIV
jgi:alcohol dehydrogenase